MRNASVSYLCQHLLATRVSRTKEPMEIYHATDGPPQLSYRNEGKLLG